jgi:MFS family permease
MNHHSASNALIISLISIPIFIGALDLTVVSAVLPHVIYDLQIPQTEINSAAWIVSGYLLAYTIAMIFMGRLSDLIDRRKVYLIALVIFALGSYLVAVADAWPTHLALRVYYLFFEGRPDPARVSLLVLVAARMVQALGGGAMVPVGMALAGDLYPAELRARPLGIIAAVDTAGWVVGHLYGGVVTRYFDWRVIFWLNLPVCLLGFVLIALALRGLPFKGDGEPRQLQPGRMDWLGAVLIGLCLAALTIGLGGSDAANGVSAANSLPASGPPVYALPLVGAALVFLASFILRLRLAAFPLIPLGLFRRLNFSAASLANLLIGFALFIAIANVPLFINTLVAKDLTQGAWDSGWMLSGLTVPMALASIPGGWLAVRFGYRWPALVGLAASVAGFALMGTWVASTPYVVMIPHLALAGVGLGLTIAPIAAAAINAAPASYRGAASALVIIFRLVGMTASVSGMAAFDQQRFNTLSARLLAVDPDLVKAGMTAITTVIRETFWIAGLVCGLAFIPILLLKSERRMQ